MEKEHIFNYFFFVQEEDKVVIVNRPISLLVEQFTVNNVSNV